MLCGLTCFGRVVIMFLLLTSCFSSKKAKHHHHYHHHQYYLSANAYAGDGFTQDVSGVPSILQLEEVGYRSEGDNAPMGAKLLTWSPRGLRTSPIAGSKRFAWGMDITKSIRNSMMRTFLPIGYPSSVPAEYLTYQIYNIVQDFCSYLRGVMSTQAILEGMGVGRSDVTALQATANWLLRDG